MIAAFQFLVAVATAILGILLCLGFVKLAQAVLPHDPPIDALYGDSLMTRMKALKHEHEGRR